VQVAVVQPRLRVGEVEENLVRLEDLIRDAVHTHRPQLVILPESASSPTVYDRSLARAARPIDGAPLQLFRHLSRELDVVIGGGFLAHRGPDVYASYALAEPDGGVHLSNHNGSTFWGRHYSRAMAGRPRRSALATFDGAPVGVACGWEWARADVARHLRHRVQLLLGGTCWPSYPLNWSGPLDRWMHREHHRQVQQARELPRQVARLLGVPVVLASHVGTTSFPAPMASGRSWETELLGESQIVDRDGTVLARLSAADGEGHAAATVTLEPPAPVDPLTELDWIPSLSATTRSLRGALRLHGALGYHSQRLLRRHHWQDVPGADLCDEMNPGEPGEQASATSGPSNTRPR
jgi:predicted amidohydrolase